MRFLIILLLIIGIILTACATAGENKAAENNTQSDITTTPAELKSGVPNNKRFDGETINLLNDTYYKEDSVTLNVSEYTGDVVNDAVYERNLLVQERLNLKIEMFDNAITADGMIIDKLKATVLSGANEYDLVSGTAFCMSPVVVANYLMNLYDSPYIDYSNPWWAKDFIEEITIGKNKYYCLAGDFTVTILKQMGCIYVNKNLYNDYFGDPNGIYDIVLSDNWTIDKLAEMGKGCYVDVKGDGKRDKDDQYGYSMMYGNLTDLMTYGAGIKVTSRDVDNNPILVLNSERTVNFTNKLYSLMYENEGCIILDSTNEVNNVIAPNMFKSNHMVFMPSFLYVSEFLRDMETDYGIIPIPKYDITQENYLTLDVHIMSLFAVPTTCEKFDAVCAVMEEMSYQGYNMIKPVYYEVALKNKYMRDSDETALKVIDILRETVTCDFSYIFYSELGGISTFMRNLMGKKDKNFVSYYASIQEGIQIKLDDLTELYMTLG